MNESRKPLGLSGPDAEPPSPPNLARQDGPLAKRAGERVLVAMSGGVDSSVAALRLVEQGYDVVGVTLHLWDYPDETPEKSRCCAPEDAHDARLVAAHLNIPHYTFDRRELFAEQVVAPFVSAYLAGETPSPCVWCNRTVKMHELFELADRLGASWVATGHYASVVRADDTAALHRGADTHKDQSYFLHMLNEAQLARLILPLADATKAVVRHEAREANLPGADKGESQELCFIASGEYRDFVEERADGRIRPGPILNGEGKVLGQHEGLHRFTVGQRRGLGVAIGTPAFVSKIDAESNAVVVGDASTLLSHGAKLAADSTWHDGVGFPLSATVKIRSHHLPAKASVNRGDDGCYYVAFDEPVRAVSPGQVAVAYLDGKVLGGGTIVGPWDPAMTQELGSCDATSI